MRVAVLHVELFISHSQSLKDKRQVVRSLKERIRARVQAAVAEVDHQDLWQRAALGVAVIFKVVLARSSSAGFGMKDLTPADYLFTQFLDAMETRA